MNRPIKIKNIVIAVYFSDCYIFAIFTPLMKLVNIGHIDEIDINSSFENAVVIPTETVYGLAARIDNEHALKSIFEIKGRPADNPLIVHISDVEMLQELVDMPYPVEYDCLMEKFWPGPLTLIFKCKSTVSKIITGKDGSTVAIRMPSKKELINIIRRLGVPLAAPSANTSGKPSSTTVEDAMNDLGDKVALYIDGGPCEVGLESTVFGVIDGEAVILRPGAVTKEAIERTIQRKVQMKNTVETGEKVICPGQKYKHYAPIHPLYMFAGPNWKSNMVGIKETLKGSKIGLLKRRGLSYPTVFECEYNLGTDLTDCMKNVFSGLIFLDKQCDAIFVVEFELKEEGVAIMDRLSKSASYIIH